VKRYQRVIVAACLCLAMTGAATAMSAATLSLGADVPAYELTNWDGRRISSDSLKGSRTIVAFTYAKCVRACPMLTFQLRGLDRHLGSPADVNYVHISVNSTEDTPYEILKHFRKYDIDPRTDPRWLFLTGDPGDTATVLKDFGIEVTRTPAQGGSFIEHTIRVFVVNPQGKLAAEFDTYQWDENRMRNALGTTLERP